jgi:hypothetical protein
MHNGAEAGIGSLVQLAGRCGPMLTSGAADAAQGRG